LSTVAGQGPAFALRNTGNTNSPYIEFQMIPSSTDQASTVRYNSVHATTVTDILSLCGTGVTAGTPTGGFKGLGTMNFAADIYKNNTAYTNPDYVLEHWATGAIVRFADRDGADRYDGLWPLSRIEAYAREHHVLPRIAEAREASGSAGLGAFGGGDAVLASLEEAYLHLFDMERRLTALEGAHG
jgi:hypothetical protein